MADTSATSPGTMANDTAVGTAAWSNSDNAKASDGSYAITNGLVAANVTNYLKATNFGFSIPSGATIDGIVVEIEKYAVSGNVKDSKLRIVNSDGSIGTTDRADTVSNWPSSDSYISYGSSSDLWGETWLASDINDSDFGVALSAIGIDPDDGYTPHVDHIRITIYYTETASGPANLKSINGLAKASIKSRNGLAIASIKSINGLQ